MTIQQLREKLAALNKTANAQLAEKGDRVWSKDEQATFDKVMDEAEDVQRQIANAQRLLDQDAEKNFRDAPANDGSKKTDAQRGVEIFLRKGAADRTADEALLVRNTMSTSTGSQGGYTVPVTVASTLVDALKDYGGMRRVAAQISTAAGNDMSFPTTDGTAEIGEIVSQNTPANASDPTFGTAPVNVYKFGSKVIAIPIELLQDTAIDILALIYKRMRDRIGRIQNVKFSQGSGTGEPPGLVTTASVGKIGATGQTTTIVYDDLVDLVDSIDVAYQMDGELTWQFGQTLRRSVRKLKDTAGRPLWTPSYDAGASKGVPDLLLGYPVNINNDMPAPAANAKSLSFGQHGKYLVRDAMDVTLFRFDDSAYLSKGQVGFLAWARAGGNLLDTAAVKTYQHAAS